MNCCKPHTGGRQQPKRWRSTSGCVGSGALLLLLPKCPLCIAAYLAVWTGAGAAISVATHLRPLLILLFCVSAMIVLWRRAAASGGFGQIGNRQG